MKPIMVSVTVEAVDEDRAIIYAQGMFADDARDDDAYEATRQPDRDAYVAATTDFERADKAASVAHDFIHGLNGVTKEQANAAIWTIHDVLRPLIPLAAHPDYAEVIERLSRV